MKHIYGIAFLLVAVSLKAQCGFANRIPFSAIFSDNGTALYGLFGSHARGTGVLEKYCLSAVNGTDTTDIQQVEVPASYSKMSLNNSTVYLGDATNGAILTLEATALHHQLQRSLQDTWGIEFSRHSTDLGLFGSVAVVINDEAFGSVAQCKVDVLDLGSSTVLEEFKIPHALCSASAYSPRGGLLGLGISAAVIRGGMVASEQTTHSLMIKRPGNRFVEVGQPTALNIVSFSEDGKYVACAGENGQVRIYDCSLLEAAPVTFAVSRGLLKLGFSTSGNYLVVAENGRLTTWSTANGKKLSEQPVGSTIFALSVDPSGQFIVAATYEQLLRFVVDASGHLQTKSSLANNPE